jgi:micrococcal nuclease
MLSQIKKQFKFLLLIAVLPSAVTAKSFYNKPSFGDFTVSRVNSIQDGDTFRVDIDDIHPLIGKNIRIRIRGVDSPEMKGRCRAEKKAAKKARRFLVKQLKTYRKIVLKNSQRGEYFRILADVIVDGENLKEKILNSGNGVPYQAFKRPNWCRTKK